MQIYMTTVGDSHKSYQASQTEAAKKRKELKARYTAKPETKTINIPTAKGPLIEWLNENVV